MSQFEKQHDRENLPLALKGPLQSFNDSPLAPLIKNALERSNIEPWSYRLEEYGHLSWHGLPATEPRLYGDDDKSLSPIVEDIYAGMENGTIISRAPTLGTVRFKQPVAEGQFPGHEGSNAHLFTRLDSVSIEGLYDSETGAVLGYSALTSSDGGRPGYVILSTNDIEVVGSNQ